MVAATPIERTGGAGCAGVHAFANRRGDLGFDDASIAKCLDHAVTKKGDAIVPSVTGKVYVHSKRMKEKRAVLDRLAAELRRIIGEPAPATHAETKLRLAA
jgi:hypothetical protein